jgi:Protein kinase domain
MEPLSANDPHAVGEFQLRARLGSGGMGRVYLGFSPAGRAVAIKVVHPELARDAEFRHRFSREVAAARAVSGMYTAPVVAAGLADDPPWLATAYVPGPSLADMVAGHGPLPEPAVWRLAAGLAEALRAVHACGLVHRDLKPANVLLAPDGPHVIDFGISRAFEGTSLTAAGMVVGTLGYMSPEQAEGAQAGPASDVFSLGCVLAYAATGTAPFGTGSAASVLYRVVTGQPDLAGVPGRLRDVIIACLAKNPAERPGLTALGTMITRAGPAVTATPTSFWPAPLAEVIRASQAHPTQAGPVQGSPVQGSPVQGEPGQAGRTRSGMVLDGYHAMATASMAMPRPAEAPRFGTAGAPGFGTGGPPTYGAAAPASGAVPAQQASWPPLTSGTPWPQPSATDAMSQYSPAPQRPWRPTPVLAAAWLMYAGAAASLLGMLVDLSVIGQLKTGYFKHHPYINRTHINHINQLAATGDFVVILGSVVSIALWLWLASACKNGHGWARTAGTVLFGVDTLGFLVTISRPGIPGIQTIHLLVWLIGLVTVIFLWRRQSSEYFSGRR